MHPHISLTNLSLSEASLHSSSSLAAAAFLQAHPPSLENPALTSAEQFAHTTVFLLSKFWVDETTFRHLSSVHSASVFHFLSLLSSDDATPLHAAPSGSATPSACGWEGPPCRTLQADTPMLGGAEQ